VDTYICKYTYTYVEYVNIQTLYIHIKTPAACNPERYSRTLIYIFIHTYIFTHVMHVHVQKRHSYKHLPYIILSQRDSHALHDSVALGPYPQIQLIVVVEQHGFMMPQIPLAEMRIVYVYIYT